MGKDIKEIKGLISAYKVLKTETVSSSDWQYRLGLIEISRRVEGSGPLTFMTVECISLDGELLEGEKGLKKLIRFINKVKSNNNKTITNGEYKPQLILDNESDEKI